MVRIRLAKRLILQRAQMVLNGIRATVAAAPWLARPAFVATVLFLSSLSVGLGAGGTAHATATAWTQGHHVKTRLVTGAEPTETGLRRIVAVHMQLDPGWKTYWRNPGNSGGIPPSFDLSRSTNLASFTVLYPAPNRYVDSTGTTFGFKNEVLFPIEVIPRDPTQPIELRLNAFFGVCEEICIPVDITLAHKLVPADFSTLTPQLASALASVPRDLNLASDATRAALPHVFEVTAHLVGDDPHLLVRAREAGAASVTEVLPVPHGDVFMGLPQKVGVEDGPDGPAVAFRLPLASRGDAQRLHGGAVDLVVIGASGAAWQTFEISK